MKFSPEADPEIEDVGPLQEEAPLLGVEQREPGQVDLAGVGLGLGEVGVVGEDGVQVAGQALVHIEAEIAGVLAGEAVGRIGFRPEGGVGPDGVAVPLDEALQAVEQPGLGGIHEVGVQPGAGPAIHFPLAADHPLRVETPGGQIRLEGDGLGRDAELGRPPVCVPAGAPLPDPVPGVIGFLALGQAVPLGPGGIDLEDVSAAPVQERVQEEGNEVVVLHVAVARHGRRHHLARLLVVAADGEVDVLLVPRHPDFGVLRRRLAGIGILLGQPDRRAGAIPLPGLDPAVHAGRLDWAAVCSGAGSAALMKTALPAARQIPRIPST